MQSIDETAEERKELTKSLEEFDNKKSYATKKMVTFSIDKDVIREFRQYCRKNGINQSQIVEINIKKELEKVKNNV